MADVTNKIVSCCIKAMLERAYEVVFDSDSSTATVTVTLPSGVVPAAFIAGRSGACVKSVNGSVLTITVGKTGSSEAPVTNSVFVLTE